MRLGSLCSGVGAFDLGLEHGLGARTVWQVEIDAYCRSVLARHWPDGERHTDIHAVSSANLVPVDALCGGFPCQPASVAGKRKAQEDPRWLWPEVARIVGELRPPLCIFENVLGLRTAGMRDVLRDLAALGYDAEWSDLSAFELGAQHIRRRLFFVASDTKRVELREQPGWLERACRSAGAAIDRFAAEVCASADTIGGGQAPGLGPQQKRRVQEHEHSDVADPDSLRRLEQSWRVATERGWPIHRGWRFDSTPRVDDVPPRGLVGAMRKAAGNAVVTACAFVVANATRRALMLKEAT